MVVYINGIKATPADLQDLICRLQNGDERASVTITARTVKIKTV